ncbi:MAG: DUF6364 family protein [Rhodothermia bacterium]
MKKLTLNADPEVIEQAKRLAEESGTSVSSLFERFIRLLGRRRTGQQRFGRITRQASGVITLPRGRNERDVLADALVEKYGAKE